MSRVKSVIPRVVRKANRVHARIPRGWHLINADRKIVGRVAQMAATILQGKHKPVFHKSRDVGDHVVIVNAEHVDFSGKKWKQKLYRHHTGYPGGMKEIPAKTMRSTHPERILERAIKGMLPKTKLRDKQLKRLKVHAGDLHTHDRQIEQIPMGEYHHDDMLSHMKVDVVETYWDKYPNPEGLVYEDEASPETNKIVQAEFEAGDEIEYK